ncbi:response regulator [Acholeplasma sp. OttesenSCG-928-E16]|nr:response regulator [Acholeplasma sp. OttesenSCG-928-E16]
MKNDSSNKLDVTAGVDASIFDYLLDELGIGSFRQNLKDSNIILTKKTAMLCGYSLSDLPNNSNTKESLIYFEDKEIVDSAINSIVSGKRTVYHIEYRMKRRDSSIVWIEECGMISKRDKDGTPLEMSAVSLDLSKLRWAEENALKSELEIKRLNLVSSNANFAEESRLLRATNAAAFLLIGGFHQDYATLLSQALSILSRSIQSSHTGIFRNILKDDRVACYKRADWFLGAMNSEVEEKEYFYEDIHNDWMNFFKDGNNSISTPNDLPRELVNALNDGESKSIIICPIYLHEDFWGFFHFAKNDGTPFSKIEADIMNDGAMLIAASISRFEALGVINQARDNAISSTIAKGEFLSRMSHEMRTPLNAIIGMSTIAKKEHDLTKITYCLEKIDTSSRQLLNIINDVLDMSKIDAGKFEIVNAPFDFKAMLDNVVSVTKVSMDQKNQSITININPSFKNLVISDELRLSQVILNLLSNATKFTKERGNITLNVFQKELDDFNIKLRVEVIDNGIGLTPEQCERLFAEFEQADENTSKKYGGTGLGLTICRKIIDLMGGEIWVNSKPNKGSCFFFEITTKLGDSLFSMPAPLKDVVDEYYDFSNKTILVADDVEINREIVMSLLDDNKAKILFAENGQEALDMIIKRNHEIDLVLMDIQMPIMDGLTATKLIREANLKREIPIVAMTANAFQEDIDVCLKAGMDDHISKPIDYDVFLKVIKKHIL